MFFLGSRCIMLRRMPKKVGLELYHGPRLSLRCYIVQVLELLRISEFRLEERDYPSFVVLGKRSETILDKVYIQSLLSTQTLPPAGEGLRFAKLAYCITAQAP